MLRRLDEFLTTPATARRLAHRPIVLNCINIHGFIANRSGSHASERARGLEEGGVKKTDKKRFRGAARSAVLDYAAASAGLRTAPGGGMLAVDPAMSCHTSPFGCDRAHHLHLRDPRDARLAQAVIFDQ
jgi:hypothetical protein